MKSILFFLAVFISTYVLSQESFIKYYHTNNKFDYINDIYKFNDSSYIIAASFYDEIDSCYVGNLILMNKVGDIIKTYNFNKEEIKINNLIIDDNIYIFGNCYTNGLVDTGFFLKCIDFDFQEIWSKEYLYDLGSEWFQYNSILDKELNKFIVCCNLLWINDNTGNIIFFEVSKNGDSISFNIDNQFRSNAPTINNFYNGNYLVDYYDARLDISGEKIAIFNKNFQRVKEIRVESPNGIIYRNLAQDVNLLKDSTFIFNTFYLSENYHFNLIINKYDSTLNFIKDILFANADSISDLSPTWSRSADITDEGDVFFTGYASDCWAHFCDMPSYIMISKFDKNLNVYWQKYYTDYNSLITNSVIATDDGGCIVLATVYFFSTTKEVDMLILKIDADGNLTHINGEKASNNLKNILVYPNPANEEINIVNEFKKSIIFEIYDINGKFIYSEMLNNYISKINISSFSSGTYIYKCYSNISELESGMFIKN